MHVTRWLNIFCLAGSGQLCGLVGYAGADINGLALVFMRTVTNLTVSNYQAVTTNIGMPSANYVGQSYFSNKLSTPGQLTTTFDTSQSNT